MTSKRDQEDTERTARAVEAVFEHWLATGNGMTADELAEAVDVSASTIRRIIGKHGGAFPGTTCSSVTRTKYSTNYPGMSVGEMQVVAWEPSETFLRNRIKVMRAELAAKQ